MTRQWMEQVMPDGRKYLYNPDTGERVWDEAGDSGSTRTSAHNNTWVEMASQATGKKYFYNTLTKESVWELPASLSPDSTIESGNEKERGHREQVFMQLLAEKGVSLEWTWERTLKEIISHPDYRAIPTLAERKSLWERYAANLKSDSSHVLQQTMLKCQQELFLFLDTLEIPNNITFWDLKNSLLDFEEFVQIRNKYSLKDSDYAQLFTEWMAGTEDKREEDGREMRRHAKEFVHKHIGTLQLTALSRWSEHKDTLFANHQINEFLCEQILYPKDILYAFEDALDQAEEVKQPAAEGSRTVLNSLLTQVRKLLTQLVGVREDWLRIWNRLEQHALINDLILLLDTPSQILQIYWDVVEEHQKIYQRERPLIEELVRGYARPSNLANENAFADFCKRRQEISTFSSVTYYHELYSSPSGPLVEHNIQDTVKAEDPELQKKRLIELFKYSLKHNYEPPITLGSRWEDYASKIHASSEYQRLPDKSLASHYFEKYQKYIAKKALIGESNVADEAIEEGEVVSEVKRHRT